MKELSKGTHPLVYVFIALLTIGYIVSEPVEINKKVCVYIKDKGGENSSI